MLSFLGLWAKKWEHEKSSTNLVNREVYIYIYINITEYKSFVTPDKILFSRFTTGYSNEMK